jgi:hypothetical protein
MPVIMAGGYDTFATEIAPLEEKSSNFSVSCRYLEDNLNFHSTAKTTENHWALKRAMRFTQRPATST